MRSMLLALAAVAMTTPAQADTRTPKGDAQWCAKHRACAARVAARHQRRHRLRTIRPYIGWLRSTGDCENGPYGGAGLKEGLRAYNPAGPFYNRYQFMWGTWASVGGRGDPRAAGWLEQAYRAVLLLRRSGNGQWPVCGH